MPPSVATRTTRVHPLAGGGPCARWHDVAMWSGARRYVALVPVALALVACSTSPAEPSRSPSASSSARGTPSASPSPTERSAPAPEEDPGPVRIAVVGDIHFEGPLAARLRDPASALAPVADSLTAADL